MSKRRSQAAIEADLAALLIQLKKELGPTKFAKLVERLSATKDEPAPLSPNPAPRRNDAYEALVVEIEALMAPLLARADEKARLLVDAAAAAGADIGDIPIKGLRPTVRRMQARLSDDVIRKAARAVMAQAQAYGSLRETVV